MHRSALSGLSASINRVFHKKVANIRRGDDQ